MEILITGGTGFIGSALTSALLQRGDTVWLVSRSPKQAYCQQLISLHPDRLHLVVSLSDIPEQTPISHIINLAGESLASGRWTRKRKALFVNSRCSITRELVSLIARLETKPKQLISGSAIGFYGANGDDELDEAADAQPGFSHELCQQWEAEAIAARQYGLAVCLLRIGIVLDNGGGSLPEMTQTCRWGFTVSMGSGQQWMSWIHRDDLVAMILFALEQGYDGPLNGTAPSPVRHNDFMQAIAETYNSHMTLPLPAWFLRLAIGEMADELLLSGQCVVPKRALNDGFQFQYTRLRDALKDIRST